MFESDAQQRYSLSGESKSMSRVATDQQLPAGVGFDVGAQGTLGGLRWNVSGELMTQMIASIQTRMIHHCVDLAMASAQNHQLAAHAMVVALETPHHFQMPYYLSWSGVKSVAVWASCGANRTTMAAADHSDRQDRNSCSHHFESSMLLATERDVWTSATVTPC
jgi:hypothetical protein